MRHELRNGFGRVYLIVEVGTVTGWVCVSWKGYPAQYSIRKSLVLQQSVKKSTQEK